MPDPGVVWHKRCDAGSTVLILRAYSDGTGTIEHEWVEITDDLEDTLTVNQAGDLAHALAELQEHMRKHGAS